MSPPISTITDPTFSHLAHHVITTNQSLVVETTGKRKVVISPYIDEEAEDSNFFHLLDRLRAPTAHLRPEEQQRLADEMDDAILAEREQRRVAKRTSL